MLFFAADAGFSPFPKVTSRLAPYNHQRSGEKDVLSPTSHVESEKNRGQIDVAKWLKSQRVGVLKHARGFDELEGWSLNESSHGKKP